MNSNRPVLYILSGLPGTGKTTIAQLFAQHIQAVYLRIDTIEQALRGLGLVNVVDEGYRLSYRIASDNLLLGNNVIADCCNPLDLTRTAWEQVALRSKARFINIECVCSDKAEHRKRVETRTSSIPGLVLPTWEQIGSREYDPWTAERIVIDTAGKSQYESFEELLSKTHHYRQ